MHSRRGALAGALLALLLTGCQAAPGPSGTGTATPTPAPSPPASGPASLPAVPLTIFGAASLTGALAEIKSAWETAAPGSRLIISADSSATLAAQIELGAPADVFLSADTANPARLAQRALTAGPAVVFAGNALVIVATPGNPAGIAGPFDLARPGIRIIAAGDAVPISTYARQVVRNVAGLSGAPAGFEAAYNANVQTKEDNVRAVVAKVELGEGDAAIVYLTDARLAPSLATVELPAEANVRASYAGVVVGTSPNRVAAGIFLEWLAGPAGQAVLERFGFLPPD